MRSSLIFLALGLSAATLKVEDARSFLDKVEAQLLTLSVDSSRADWVRSTYITDDTEIDGRE